nr:uracil-DNA glycosylase [Bordetella genomosp. 9]
MVDPTAAPVKSFALNPLQRAWLREIGMEKVWLRQESPQPAGEGASARRAPSSPAGEVGVGPASTGPAGPAGRMHAGSAAGADAAAASGSSGAASAPAAGTGAGIDASLTAGPDAGVDAAAARHPGSGAAATAAAGAPSTQGRPTTAAPQGRPPMRPGKPPAAPAASEPPPLQPPPTAESLAMLDMPTLRERVLECRSCGLCQGRRQAVFGMGAENARWLVVGEAPGEQEDRQGLPFVGRSGQLLDAMLAAVGMSRERDVYIANVIKCRPPGNRNPKPEEIAACRPYLMRQIALLKPQRILVMGRFAAQTLLETDAAIGSLRGRVHTLKTDAGEIPMVVSYHPAYLLRSPVEKARAWQDLRLAAGF